MMKIILTLFVALSALNLSAQSEVTFSVAVSTDSVLMDNYFEITFTLQNAIAEEFTPPDFEHFKVLSGPNVSSRTSIINGKKTQSASYSYYLKPLDVGSYFIEPAYAQIGDTAIASSPIEVSTYPNPDGILQQPKQEKSMWDSWFNRDLSSPFPSENRPTKKKKLTKRI